MPANREGMEVYIIQRVPYNRGLGSRSTAAPVGGRLAESQL